MKNQTSKLVLIGIALLLTFSVSAAGNAGGFKDTKKELNSVGNAGGFKGPSMGLRVTTVVDALKAKDDTKATLTGHILSAKTADSYVFEDSTGQIEVEIDDDIWAGQTVTPETKVILYGEVDKGFSLSEVDVDRIEIAP